MSILFATTKKRLRVGWRGQGCGDRSAGRPCSYGDSGAGQAGVFGEALWRVFSQFLRYLYRLNRAEAQVNTAQPAIKFRAGAVTCECALPAH